MLFRNKNPIKSKKGEDMKKIISIIAILVVSVVFTAISYAAEDNLVARMEYGDLSLEEVHSALENGDFKKVEKIATLRAS